MTGRTQLCIQNNQLLILTMPGYEHKARLAQVQFAGVGENSKMTNHTYFAHLGVDLVAPECV